MNLEPAIINDIDSFVTIEFSNMTPLFQTNPEWNIDFVQKSVHENLSRAWKLVENGLLGFYYWVPDEDCAVLLSIQVSKALQSNGHGSQLLEHFEAQARKYGYSKVGLTVHTNNPAYNWYLKNGFKYIENDGPNCHVMIKKLKH